MPVVIFAYKTAVLPLMPMPAAHLPACLIQCLPALPALPVGKAESMAQREGIFPLPSPAEPAFSQGREGCR